MLYLQNKNKDITAQAFIQQAVTPTIISQIRATTTAKEAWSILNDAYRGTDKVVSIKLQTLCKEFDNLSMKKSEIIQVFFNRVTNIVNSIKILGDSIEDKKIVQQVLRSLLPKFDHIVAVIEESKDLSTLSAMELMGSLQVHEEIKILLFN